LDGNIYTIRGQFQTITVFRAKDYYLVKEIKDERFGRLLDIVACISLRILYTLEQACVWQIDENGNVSEYVSLIHLHVTTPTLSVRGTQLLVTSSNGIRKYTRGIWGPTPADIRLPVGLSGAKLWHAQEVHDGYVTAYVERGTLHRVSKFREGGIFLERGRQVEYFVYGTQQGEGTDQLSNPVYLAVEPKHGHIFVADHDNQRVVLLDSKFHRFLIISELPEGCYPTRLCYVDERKELFVGTSNGYIMGYKFTRYVDICVKKHAEID